MAGDRPKEDQVTENVYTRIVVAAREARRLNASRVEGTEGPKVTTEAIRRAEEGEVEWEVAQRGEEPEVEEKKSEDYSFDD